MGASGSYKIYGDDLEQYIKEYGDYFNALQSVVENGKKAIQDLVDLPSFSGSAADSIKRYFSDVHIQGLSLNNMVTEAIQTALTQAFNDYRCANTGGVSSHFVPENCDDFYFTSQEFLDKQTWINNDLKETKLQSITDEIRASQYDLEGTGINITPVSTATLWESLDELVHVLQDMDQGVSYIDSQGAKRFQDNSVIADTLHALQEVLDNWTSSTYDITNYPTNLFSEALSKGGATELLGNLVTYIDEHHDEMVQTWQDCANMVYNRKIAEKEEQKFWVDFFGLLLGVGIVILDGFLIASTGGVALPVLFSVAAFSDSLDLLGRFSGFVADFAPPAQSVFQEASDDLKITGKGAEVVEAFKTDKVYSDKVFQLVGGIIAKAMGDDHFTFEWKEGEDLYSFITDSKEAKEIISKIIASGVDKATKLSAGKIACCLFQDGFDVAADYLEYDLYLLNEKKDATYETIEEQYKDPKGRYADLPCFQFA